jgi:ATP-binding cassette subfamily B protein
MSEAPPGTRSGTQQPKRSTRVGAGLGKAMRSAFTTAPALTSTTAFLALVMAVEPTVYLLLSSHLVGSLPAAIRDGGGSEAAAHVRELLIWTLAVFGVSRLVPTLQGMFTGRLGRRMNSELQRRVTLACQTPLHLEHFDDQEVQGAISLVRDDTGGMGLPGTAIGSFFGVIGAKLSPLGGVAILLHYSWWVGLAALAIYLMLLSGMLRALMLLAGAQVTARASFLPAEYLRTTSLDAKPARELRVFGLSPWVRGRVDAVYTQAMRKLWRERDRFAVALGLGLLVVTGTFGALLLTSLANQATSGALSLTVFLTVFNATTLLVSINLDGEDLRAMLGGAAMSAILSLEQKAAVAREHSRLTSAAVLSPLAPQTEIRFDKVALRHSGSDVDVLADLDLIVPAGQRLALVGLNGAGKTTLATVLAGLRRPTRGRVLVDGVDLATVDYAVWQRRVAVLSQNFVHYPLSGYDNIAVGGPEVAQDRDAVLHAAELGGAAQVIAGIEGGWDTVLSPTVKDGVDLSGGQWQRIGLARALLAVAAGARVLVLDEPTSALDVRAEAALFAELIAMPALRDITVILISHRFSSVRQAERIVFLDAGAVAEDGSHEELLAVQGGYAELFNFQAALFNEDAEGLEPADA